MGNIQKHLCAVVCTRIAVLCRMNHPLPTLIQQPYHAFVLCVCGAYIEIYAGIWESETPSYTSIHDEMKLCERNEIICCHRNYTTVSSKCYFIYCKNSLMITDRTIHINLKNISNFTYLIYLYYYSGLKIQPIIKFNPDTTSVFHTRNN